VLCKQKRELDVDPVVPAANAGHREHFAVVVFALELGLALDREVFLGTEEAIHGTTIAQTLKIAALPFSNLGIQI
jgi:hypothetical protein